MNESRQQRASLFTYDPSSKTPFQRFCDQSSIYNNMSQSHSVSGTSSFTRKRKQEDDRGQHGFKRQRAHDDNKASTQAKLLPQTKSFLELPAEIRNNIYAYTVASDSTLRIDEKNIGRLTSASPFTTLDREIRKENLSMLPTNAWSLNAVVKDLDFTHIMAFIDQLTHSGHSTGDQLIIHLVFSPNCTAHPPTQSLEQWAMRRTLPHTRAFHLDVCYRLNPKTKKTWKKYDNGLQYLRNSIRRIPKHDGRREFNRVVQSLYGRGIGVALKV